MVWAKALTLIPNNSLRRRFDETATSFIVDSKLDIHNANALSSSYTIGFPAMTAWMGAMHFLQRQLHQKGFDQIQLTGLAVSCHSMDLQTYKEDRGFISSIIGTGNPLDKTGNVHLLLKKPVAIYRFL